MLAICGGKGGSGKTTTTLGIAGALADEGRSVLAVDADRDMPDLHVAAGVPGDPTVDALLDDPEPTVSAVANSVPGTPEVGIVPAAPGVDRDAVTAGVDRVRRSDAVGLVDCPAGADRRAVAPVRAADRALVVTTPAPASVRDAAKTAAIARAVGTPVVGAVVTRARSVPEGVDRLFDGETVAVGTVTTPLSTGGVDAHREIVRLAWQELFSGSPCN